MQNNSIYEKSLPTQYNGNIIDQAEREKKKMPYSENNQNLDQQLNMCEKNERTQPKK
jgi:hypothetical protein